MESERLGRGMGSPCASPARSFSDILVGTLRAEATAFVGVDDLLNEGERLRR